GRAARNIVVENDVGNAAGAILTAFPVRTIKNPRLNEARVCVPARIAPRQAGEADWLQRRVLQLLQRADLDLDRRRLGSEPLLLAGERVLAETLLGGGHLHGGDLQQAGQREFARALL